MLGPVELVAEVDSTNSELLRRARDGAADGLVLVADHQTAGRGRLDRRWEALPGAALLVSVLLRPQLPPDRLFLLSWAAGLAAVDAARSAGVDAVLKWPNDVLVRGRKLAGILAESILEGGRPEAVVVGMGLNLRAGRLPEGAVALGEAAGREVDRAVVLDAWLDAFDSWRARDTAGIRSAYRRSCDTIGRRVRIDRGHDAIEARAVDVDDDGHLVLDTGLVVPVGDVVHLRTV